MDISLFFDTLKEYASRNINEFFAFLAGMALIVVIWFFAWLRQRSTLRTASDASKETLSAVHDKYEAEKETLRFQSEEARKRIDGLTAQLEDQQEALQADADKIKSLEQDNHELREEFDHLTAQLETLTKLDGDVWERPPRADQIPPFRTLTRDRPPIIAVVNLKGGVGKTTITANLAAAALHLGQRPLLVDLDYQNSLSGLTLDAQLRADISSRGQVVSRLIDSPNPSGTDLLNLTQRIGNENGFVLASDECLTTVEMQVMAQWITNGTDDDVRYRLRRALHSDEVQSAFDVILIDCPPRITTACVNALAACDYVLIPALLDSLSLEAVPRILKWLRTFKVDRHICPNMSVLGVVGNRAHNSKGMSSKQHDVWFGTAGDCLTSWGEPVYQFKTPVPDAVAFADAAKGNSFAADADKLRPVFLDLFNELMQRIPFHAGQGTAAVSR